MRDSPFSALGIAGRFIGTHVTLFRLLYFSVALYTLRHSAIGVATIEQDGNMFWPILAALILDIGMLLAAEKLRERITAWLVIGLLLSCAGSAYTQLLFAVTNAQAVTIAPGAIWASIFATYIIEWRVIVLPVVMPVLVIVYAFASKAQVPQPELFHGKGSDTIPDLADVDLQRIALLQRRLTGEFTRNQIETVLEVSKRTAGNLIATAVGEGVMERLGSGRSTRYRFNGREYNE